MMNREQGTRNVEVGEETYLVSENFFAVEENNEGRKYNLNERLIEFSVLIIRITETISPTRAGIYLAEQLVRSGTAPALQYGEAQGAESRNDFIHKIKILTKELRESLNSLKIIKRVPLTKNLDLVEQALTECNELISIFVKVFKPPVKIIRRNDVMLLQYSLFLVHCSIFKKHLHSLFLIPCSIFII